MTISNSFFEGFCFGVFVEMILLGVVFSNILFKTWSKIIGWFLEGGRSRYFLGYLVSWEPKGTPNPPPRNKALIRPDERKPMVSSPLTRPYFLGVNVALGGGPLGSHEPMKWLQWHMPNWYCMSTFEQWKKPKGWLGYIGDEILPSYIGIIA